MERHLLQNCYITFIHSGHSPFMIPAEWYMTQIGSLWLFWHNQALDFLNPYTLRRMLKQNIVHPSHPNLQSQTLNPQPYRWLVGNKGIWSPYDPYIKVGIILFLCPNPMGSLMIMMMMTTMTSRRSSKHPCPKPQQRRLCSKSIWPRETWGHERN